MTNQEIKKRWFIDGDSRVLYIHSVVSNETDSRGRKKLVVATEYESVEPYYVAHVSLRLVSSSDSFETKEEAQMEIIRREHFEKKKGLIRRILG